MAVAVEQDVAGELRRLITGDTLFEEFAKEEGLTAQLAGAGMVGEEILEFVAEDRGAAGFEDDDGVSSVDLRPESLEDSLYILLRLVEHSEVVEGASAAEVALRDFDGAAGVGEDFERSLTGLGMIVVVEGVGPEDYLGAG